MRTTWPSTQPGATPGQGSFPAGGDPWTAEETRPGISAGRGLVDGRGRKEGEEAPARSGKGPRRLHAGGARRCSCAGWRRRTTQGSARRRKGGPCCRLCSGGSGDGFKRPAFLGWRRQLVEGAGDVLVNKVLKADVARLEVRAAPGQALRPVAPYLVAARPTRRRSGLQEARTLLADAARLRPEWSLESLLSPGATGTVGGRRRRGAGRITSEEDRASAKAAGQWRCR